ncbi:MAG: thermonuclease family protein [Acidimicrobiaceae bacterium]|nr:thermonuclease family protein [Acidimicrobiaceae bacterium]
MGSNCGSLHWCHWTGVLVLVLVSSCGTPPVVDTTGGEVQVGTDDGHRWAPNATVERVVDGDTIDVLVGGRQETVRLIGIDAPESVAPTRPVQCFGKEASLHLEAVLPEGTEVTLVRDVETRDAYQRLLGYVVRSRDGLFVNLELVVAGYAAALNYPPNDHYASVIARAEADAVAADRGLWGHCGGPDVPLG